MRPPHTQLNDWYRLHFPFVFRQIQSLQLLLLAHPCRPLSLSAFSGPSVPRLIAASLPLSDPRCFRVLSSASVLGSDYSASVSSFPFSSCFRLTVASSVLVFRFHFLRFPRSLLPGFPCIPSRFRYSASLYVSFRPSLSRSHSCSSGAYFQLSPSVFSASLPLPFVCFRFASGYSALCFFLSVLPVSASQWLPRCSLSAFASWAFPILSCLISHAFFPGFRTRLSVGFLSSFPASLPQLFHR